jgi:photosystem II stability/assembly factor-like uncharacterized protein
MRLPFLTLIAAVLSFAPARGATNPFFNDAALRAVQFVDDKEGWAVGDDGGIWHTIDGGGNWERQPSGVRASLRAIHFLSPYTGWVVGREELPGGASRGVVLATTDGGLKWMRLAANALPGLNCVHFFNERNGIAAGDGCDVFPTGVFTTVDGGRTWLATPGQRCPTWLAADFIDTETGSLAGAWSRLATLRGGLFGAADVDSIGSRSVRGLKIHGKQAVAVGDGGLILLSSNSAGLRWGFADLRMPTELVACIDFHAVSVSGSHIWAVGRPGSIVVHSPDQGATWEFQRTGQPLPLHAVHFINDNDGWAAGEMGTIVRTKDGGKNWKVEKLEQHTGQRAAALFIHASGPSMPLDVAAILAEEEGYHTAAIAVTSADPASADPRHATDPERLAAAIRASGASAAESLWQFPVPRFADGIEVKELLANWDQLHGEKSAEQLLRQLVLALRVWRPEVVVTDAMPAGNAAEGLIIEAMKEAMKQAADASAFAEQIDKLGLEAWGPKKLYALTQKPAPSAVRVDVAKVYTRLADSATEAVWPAQRLLADEPNRPTSRAFRLLVTRIKDGATHAELMAGTELAYGGTARRKLPPLTKEEESAVAEREKAFQVRKNLELLASADGGALANPNQALAQVEQSLKDLPRDMAARGMFAIASRYARDGQWHLAREMFLLLADRHPGHPLTAEAYRWLMRYHSSSEARRREELGHFLVAGRTTVQLASGEEESNLPPKSEVVTEQRLMLLRNQAATRKWYEGSLAIEARYAAYGPLFARDPATQLCLASARRQLGDVESPRKWFQRYLAQTAVPEGGQPQQPGADPWRDCVLAEAWLADRTTPQPPKPLGYCKPVVSRPHLDGKLDDECWEGARPLTLKTCAGELDKDYSAKALFGYDNEFLYVAVQCSHPQGKQVPAVTKRTRDADLRGFDRVNILLDLDRDYQTYFRFQVDQRGCVAEDCWGDLTWNPRWFVAVNAEETGWTAEIAIPLAELTGDSLTPGKVWACNVTRVVPGKGLQTWSGPADVEPRPEGMGLLQFLGDPKR